MVSARFPIWWWMVAVVAAAVLCTAIRYDSSCTPVAPMLGGLYACSIAGSLGGIRTGRGALKGLLLGFFLGPFGLILACSRRAPDHWGEERRDEGG